MSLTELIGLVVGDITNWMNSTSGAFNYTGLVENMKVKAGSFYGRETGSRFQANDSIDNVFQLATLFLGIGLLPMSRELRIISCRTRHLEFRRLSRRRVWADDTYDSSPMLMAVDRL
jgi:hypothetical protein